MRNFTIFKRLGLGYLVILLLVASLGMYSAIKLRQVNQITRYINSIDSETIRRSTSLRDAVLSQRKFEKKYIVSRDEDYHRQFLETGQYIKKDLAQLDSLMDSPRKKRLFGNIKQCYDQYLSAVEEETHLIADNYVYSQDSYEKNKDNLTNQIVHDLETTVEAGNADMAERIEMSGEIGTEAAKVAIIIAAVSIVVAILIAFVTARTINHPLTILIKGTKEISAGRFEKHFSIKSPPEINELAVAFNHMSDRLKELDEMKADLISHLSHEFRTPLTVIREAVGLQLDILSAGTDQKQRKLLGIIGEECERLIKFVNKILDLSRMDAGMMEYHREKFNLSHLIEARASKIGPVVERKRIMLKVNIDNDLPYADIDAEKIGTVLDNLMDNALKFTSEGGSLWVKAVLKDSKAQGGLSEKGKRMIEVSISDTGCGIPEESIRGVFDKFKKLNGKGTGLGLHISRQIILAHGGDIWVKSQIRKGSTFFFTVPTF
jgi:two-component system, NtrC family, sensor histidine kinase GlrK